MTKNSSVSTPYFSWGDVCVECVQHLIHHGQSKTLPRPRLFNRRQTKQCDYLTRVGSFILHYEVWAVVTSDCICILEETCDLEATKEKKVGEKFGSGAGARTDAQATVSMATKNVTLYPMVYIEREIHKPLSDVYLTNKLRCFSP